jgi:anhydro-N-acetylmuramic acid kinase
MSNPLYLPSLNVLGLMSGTSLDGVDLCLAKLFWQDRLQYEILGFETRPMPQPLREKLLRNMQPETSRVDQLTELNVQIGQWLGASTQQFIQSQHFEEIPIDLIGSHGQTLFHLPPGVGEVAATLQLGEAAVIAEMTGITTVSDFRPADMALGGQGAPLVPYVDALLFGDPEQPVCLQNIGGIGNLTWLGSKGQMLAFDTGPGNVLIDGLVRHLSHGQLLCDQGGAWAAQGLISEKLLNQALQNPFFLQLPPKSTGREIFGDSYCEWFLEEAKELALSPADQLATATALTAQSIAQACRQFLPEFPTRFVVSGGGIHNATLMQMLAELLKPAKILPLEHFGLSSDAKEAFAFACLGYTCLTGIPNNLPAVTGARSATVMGKIQPGRNYLSLLKRLASGGDLK